MNDEYFMNLAIKLADFLTKKDAKGAVEFLNQNLEKGLDAQEFAKAFINYLRKILILQVSPELDTYAVSELEEETQNLIKKQAKSFKPEELRKLLQLFLAAETKIRYAAVPQLPLELALIEFCGVV